MTLNGQAANYSFVDSNHATVSFDCGSVLAGDNRIVMMLPAPGGGVSEGILAGINAPPSDVSASPSSVAQGAGETKLVIRAANLSPSSVLYWNGSPRPGRVCPGAGTLPNGPFGTSAGASGISPTGQRADHGQQPGSRRRRFSDQYFRYTTILWFKGARAKLTAPFGLSRACSSHKKHPTEPACRHFGYSRPIAPQFVNEVRLFGTAEGLKAE